MQSFWLSHSTHAPAIHAGVGAEQSCRPPHEATQVVDCSKTCSPGASAHVMPPVHAVQGAQTKGVLVGPSTATQRWSAVQEVPVQRGTQVFGPLA